VCSRIKHGALYYQHMPRTTARTTFSAAATVQPTCKTASAPGTLNRRSLLFLVYALITASAAFPHQARADITTGLVGYWSFDGHAIVCERGPRHERYCANLPT
jgi:hypothetical protein